MSEWSAVQKPMIKYASQIGWEYLKADKALGLRGGEKGLYFTDILEAQLIQLNPGIVNRENVAEIVRQLNLFRPTIEGNRDALTWLKGSNLYLCRMKDGSGMLSLLILIILIITFFMLLMSGGIKGMSLQTGLM